MAHILLTGRIHPAGMALLEARGDVTLESIDDPTEAEFVARLPEADALIVRTAILPPSAVAATTRLKVVSRHGVGYDNVPVDALTARRIPLTVVGNVNAVTVAEHAMFFILALAKRCRSYDRAVRDGGWAIRDSFAATELDGKTLLIMGFGRIGREVAKRAAAFDMRPVAYDPHVDAGAMAEAGVEKADDWRAALVAADFVTLHLPRTPETVGMIGAGDLAAMKPTAYLVNTARGGLVDETALAEALRAGRIAGAGIDTFDREPPAADHPLLGLDGVLLSPHTAGLTEECAARMGLATARNALDGIDGRLDPELVVNRDVLAAGG
ncbi:MAG: hydroxyacid dehydrogenase [Inquilinus sp.]|nr:hydroxyacid dehydrogenase [Inquilinus sp.]